MPLTVLQPLKANPDLATRIRIVGLASLQKSEAETACKDSYCGPGILAKIRG